MDNSTAKLSSPERMDGCLSKPALPPDASWPSWGTAVVVGIFASAGAFLCAQVYGSSLNTIWIVIAWLLGATGTFALLVGAIALGVSMGTADLRSLIEAMLRARR